MRQPDRVGFIMKSHGTAMKITNIFGGLALLLAASPTYAQDHNFMPPTGVPQVGPSQEVGPEVGNVITPYRFNPAPKQLSPSDQQEALEYKGQLQNQERNLEQQQVQRSPNPFKRQQLIDTQRELNRMNSILHP